MLAMIAEVKVYVAFGATDMRKSNNGLSLLIEEHFSSTCSPPACWRSAKAHEAAIQRTLAKLYGAEKHHLVLAVFSLAETITSLIVADETSEAMKAVASMQLIEQALDGSADLPETMPTTFIDAGGEGEQ